MKKFFLIFLIIICASSVYFYNAYNEKIPNRYAPWKPIKLYEKPSFLTKYKLGKLKDNPQACMRALDEIPISYKPLDDREVGTCALNNQIHIEKSLFPYSAPVKGNCALMAALIAWEKNVLETLSKDYFDQPVKMITHYGIFSCRNVRGSNRVSEHAKANAIDIAAITLDDGTVISVLKHWDDGGKKGQFLKALRDGSCDYFKGVLGPEYNSLHNNHFHFDLGPYRICR
ncbi:MAG: extensin [Rickettsiales bacterium]|nr:extensin [Rickettsiales bacterium]